MKRFSIYLTVLVMGWAFFGCEENEIDLYDQNVRINFARTYNEVVFRDSDYVKGHTEKELSMIFQLQGTLLDAERSFCLKTRENDKYSLKAEVVYDQSYTFPADTMYATVQVRVRRPEKVTGKILCKADVTFDLENSLHRFEAGREDLEKLELEVAYQIRRQDWNEWSWGKYSDAKYFFMMDFFKATLDGMPADKAGRKAIYEAYEEYRKTNPPILDENGEEIVFKTNF